MSCSYKGNGTKEAVEAIVGTILIIVIVAVPWLLGWIFID